MSGGWREPILAQFTQAIAAAARLTIVSDPDQLLSERGVLEGIRERGFDVIAFEDHVAFRYAYESRYRQAWDRGEDTHLVVVLRTERSDVDALPHDLLAEARRHSRVLTFSIADLFPRLAPRVVAALDRADLDVLYDAHEKLARDERGENSTKDFILRHVFRVAPEVITTPPELLRVLLQRHYRDRVFPSILDERFIHLLRQSGHWQDWPLDEIVPDRAAFFAFLAERWPRFVRSRAQQADGEVREAEEEYGFAYGGPTDLPFDHDDVRVYIDNLFLEGFLTPTTAVTKAAVGDTWLKVGVAGDVREDELDRLQRLIEKVERELPGEGASHEEWIQTAQRWAEAVALRWQVQELPDELSSELERLHDRVEEGFSSWMLEHYGALYNLSYLPKPVMVHQVPRFLAHGFVPASQKLALLVIDGMAYDQWALVRRDIDSIEGVETDEGGVFAWVPTLTAVSRQSIFAGDPPMYFAPSIQGTQKEERHWKRFWENRGARSSQVAYVRQQKQENDDSFLSRVREAAEHPRCRVLGIVVNTLDRMIHGTPTGTRGLHAVVRDWIASGAPRKLVEVLLQHGFQTSVTADHGNIEGTGFGKPNVGATAEERGERAHVFSDDRIRAEVHGSYPKTLVWSSTGIPEDYKPLLAEGRGAFLGEGKRSVAHGGIALEEVIVPFVSIRKRS